MTSLTVIGIKDGTNVKVVVRTADEKEQEFEAAVITTPLGWLKRHKDAITPLSERITQAIDALSYGNLEKVQSAVIFSALSSSLIIIQTLIEFPFAFWDSDSLKSDDDVVSFVHWLSPSYASSTNPQAWRLECVNFNAFPPPYRRNILLFYTFGECSRHITARIHDMEDQARFNFLCEFFEPYYSRLPNFDPQTCTPQRVLATEWSQDEFAGFGSYSNFQVGVTDAAGDVKALRHGMPEHSIYFAGEHTAPFDGLGTVAGAYASGENIAKRIIQSIPSTN